MFSERIWNPSIGFWVSSVLLVASTGAVAIAINKIEIRIKSQSDPIKITEL
jgi:hypothetical protein